MKEKHNISTINSVAPMSLQSQQDFVAHQKTSYPFIETQPIPKFYKIVLQAADRVAGAVNEAKFNINIANPLPKNAVLCVKDFIPLYAQNTHEENKNYLVYLPELLANNSYQAINNGETDILFVGKNAYVNPVYAGSFGVPITNQYFFNNKQITIKVASNATITDWVLVLVIYAYE